MNRYKYSLDVGQKLGEWGLVAVPCVRCNGKGREPRTEFNNIALPLPCLECQGSGQKHEKKWIRFEDDSDE